MLLFIVLTVSIAFTYATPCSKAEIDNFINCMNRTNLNSESVQKELDACYTANGCQVPPPVPNGDNEGVTATTPATTSTQPSQSTTTSQQQETTTSKGQQQPTDNNNGASGLDKNGGKKSTGSSKGKGKGWSWSDKSTGKGNGKGKGWAKGWSSKSRSKRDKPTKTVDKVDKDLLDRCKGEQQDKFLSNVEKCVQKKISDFTFKSSAEGGDEFPSRPDFSRKGVANDTKCSASASKKITQCLETVRKKHVDAIKKQMCTTEQSCKKLSKCSTEESRTVLCSCSDKTQTESEKEFLRCTGIIQSNGTITDSDLKRTLNETVVVDLGQNEILAKFCVGDKKSFCK